MKVNLATNSRAHRFEGNCMLRLLFNIVYIHVRLGFAGPYMIVCTYGSYAAGRNQEPVEAVVMQVSSRFSGLVMS